MEKPKNTKYLFIDMNSFFASCEQEINQCLINKPVAVTPFNGDSGCIVSASYEAKKFGIKTGTLVKEAKIICPKIIIIESNTKTYLYFHEQIKKILYSFSPFVNVMSIDEAAITLSPSEQQSHIAKKIAISLKEKIKNKLGKNLRSSIGIGPNIYLAKQASEFKKPDGLTEIKLENLADYYRRISLRDLKGINFRMESRLKSHQFYRPIDLYLSSSNNLHKHLGIVGQYWYFNLHGYDLFTTNPNQFHTIINKLPKSISHSHVLEPQYRNWESAWSICQKLIERTGYRLRKQQLESSTVELYVKCLNHYSYHRNINVISFSNSTNFSRYIKTLWKEIDTNYTPLKIAVRLSSLNNNTTKQYNLFKVNNKPILAYKAIDKINDKFGSFTIKPASILIAKNAAPNRIAFGKPITE